MVLDNFNLDGLRMVMSRKTSVVSAVLRSFSDVHPRLLAWRMYKPTA